MVIGRNAHVTFLQKKIISYSCPHSISVYIVLAVMNKLSQVYIKNYFYRWKAITIKKKKMDIQKDYFKWTWSVPFMRVELNYFALISLQAVAEQQTGTGWWRRKGRCSRMPRSFSWLGLQKRREKMWDEVTFQYLVCFLYHSDQKTSFRLGCPVFFHLPKNIALATLNVHFCVNKYVQSRMYSSLTHGRDPDGPWSKTDE